MTTGDTQPEIKPPKKKRASKKDDWPNYGYTKKFQALVKQAEEEYARGETEEGGWDVTTRKTQPVKVTIDYYTGACDNCGSTDTSCLIETGSEKKLLLCDRCRRDLHHALFGC